MARRKDIELIPSEKKRGDKVKERPPVGRASSSRGSRSSVRPRGETGRIRLGGQDSDRARRPRGEFGEEKQIEISESRFPESREVRFYGKHACEAVLRKRPTSIVKAYICKDLVRGFGALMSHCAAAKRAYHIVESEELSRVARTEHHEGVCIIVRARKPVAFPEWVAQERKIGSGSLLVVLDGVENPHNIGAILRSCAHFGVRGVALRDWRMFENGACARVARGGIEEVDVIQTSSLPDLIKDARRAGYQILSTSSCGGISVFDAKVWSGPSVLVFGSEGQGISSEVLGLCDAAVVIPGTGLVESLNVSVAAGIAFGAWYRYADRASSAKRK